MIERASRLLACAREVPTPAFRDHGTLKVAGTGGPGRVGGAPAPGCEVLTVIDTGWEAAHLLAGDGWLAGLVRDAPVVVVVARPTIPGFRRLEAALEVLEAERAVTTQVAVVGASRRRWAKGVEHSAGRRTRSALHEDRLHEFPEDRHLALVGLSSAPLPPGLLAAGERLLAAALHTRTAVPTQPRPRMRRRAQRPT